MPNDIVQNQATERFVKLLAASTQVYRECSRISRWQTQLAIFAAVLGPALAWFNPDWRAAGALFAIFALVFDRAFLHPLHKQKKELGTKIQEIFDTELFGLPWNRLKCGEKPKPADIEPLVLEYKNADPRFLNIDKTWYPPQIEPADLEYARIICQKSNLRWDGNLRKHYAEVMLAALLIFVIIGAALGVFAELTLAEYVLTYLIPTLPIARKIGDSWLCQREWAEKASDQQDYISGLWEKIASPGRADGLDLLGESRRLQDEIYERRKATPAVPGFFHRYWRARFQDVMESHAETDVKGVV